MDRKTSALIRGIQKRENADKAHRLDRILRALRKHGKKLADYELTSLESALSPAIGRIEMDA